MAVNKLALIRYKTIDDCLRNRFRKWTLEDLIEKVGEVLYDKEGISTGVSRRTIQADIQVMRSDRLGYNAPITVVDKKFYVYEDKSYSITNAPINDADVAKLKEVVGVLKQFNGFSYFDEMSDMIARLENNLYKASPSKQNKIQLEGNQLLKGLEYIMPLHQAILNETPLLIEYRSFKARQSQQQIYYPYLLKEYRNRWFLICKQQKAESLLTLALDRMLSVTALPQQRFQATAIKDFDAYYSDLLGVTKNEKDKALKVVLKIDAQNAPYIKTKPLHTSQQILSETAGGTTFSIEVIHNFELEREILGFGECIQVLSPRILKNRIKKRIQKMSDLYNNPQDS
ncbi:WYL domain-containing protein [Taibaiella sp. KBW10]|uniref:helix-turn-helix transcriptional regulator n=1 Tax=Taibaiella sp. KBW10 TaxID=2153357 RepID=UPI000F5AB933|nr:WYL domain-containing protein [Taibaiella sp. KBW10]RQO30272.1 WYL domain-containing protein [Taibaiella sp. KBW10]